MAISVTNPKLLIWSVLAILAAVLLRLSVPLILDLAIDGVPILASWLKPPYLYIVINFIIMSIFATSKLHRSSGEEEEEDESEILSPPPRAEVSTALNDAVSSDLGYLALDPKVDCVFSPERVHAPSPVAEARVLDSPERKLSGEAMDGGDFSSKKERDLDFFSDKENEKPPVSARFAHRKALKSSPEGNNNGLRRVLKPKRQDTLESTWRAITDGRAMPLTRHLKKSETIDPHARRVSDGPSPNVMRKSETFVKERGRSSPRREAPSCLSQDELNRRVEAFINKFNEEMRLQRQESLNQYREMVGSTGAN